MNSTSSSGMTDDVLSISNSSHHDQNWLLDSGVPNHMCLHKYWFSTYQPIDDGFVIMGNDISCNIVGIGSIKIKMYDGSIRTLIAVRHALELKKNHMYLRVLDSIG
jgi:hypothetical protein